ncbi:MAG: peptide-methionine (S)-S-oxide reductase MsrA [Candidatus Eremiobacteraeota bacterium]|nr:peptide-methionine (S)-S-oxide reductase MsrA [Candidatus Eremiobacteraeota bacterium]
MSKRLIGALVPVVMALFVFQFAALASKPAHSSQPAAHARGTQTVVLAGGCFWGMEAVFESLKGVSKVVSGYAGGNKATAHYEIVSTGLTGHAESVKISYDPSQISFSQLLNVYFSVAHDPTQRNRQDPDTGPQYRSAIFYANDTQKRSAQAYIRQLDDKRVFREPIVTQVVPLRDFYPAEDYHQNYFDRHPNDPYIVYNDKPKVEQLRKRFPGLIISHP